MRTRSASATTVPFKYSTCDFCFGFIEIKLNKNKLKLGSRRETITIDARAFVEEFSMPVKCCASKLISPGKLVELYFTCAAAQKNSPHWASGCGGLRTWKNVPKHQAVSGAKVALLLLLRLLLLLPPSDGPTMLASTRLGSRQLSSEARYERAERLTPGTPRLQRALEGGLRF